MKIYFWSLFEAIDGRMVRILAPVADGRRNNPRPSESFEVEQRRQELDLLPPPDLSPSPLPLKPLLDTLHDAQEVS